MGFYLNCNKARSLYESEIQAPYFVDKTALLEELFPLVKAGNRHICITRPRRFGKSVMASMVGAFFSKGFDSSGIFDELKIAKSEDYRQFLNQYDVIYIDFSEAANQNTSYAEFITEITETLREDIREAFFDISFRENTSVIWDLRTIHEQRGIRFIFVLDEWDCIFHKEYITDGDRKKFIEFLAVLTKGTGYVALTYMTGILPIAKYSSGSSINHFNEYTMVKTAVFSEYFGFTNAEVDELYERYMRNTIHPAITREELSDWYDGYRTRGNQRIYNPRSVVSALTSNELGSYWTATGPYAEISNYINNDVDGVKEDIVLMLSGEAVGARIDEFAATTMRLDTKDAIFSSMVVYGFLSCENGRVRIPNKELMQEFGNTVRMDASLGYVYRLAKESERMLEATLRSDTKIMEEILAFAHNTEVPLLSYNHETELTAIVNLVYLAARDRYRVEREEKSGKGFVDFMFYPDCPDDDGIILELKVDDTPEEAIRQIKDKGYQTKFLGKMAEKKRFSGRILAVGISYNKETKEHRCSVEAL